jgi:hypothetical protein
LNYGLEEILQVETIRFDYLEESSESSSRIGFSAQNLQMVIPEAVTGEEKLAVTPSDLIPVLVKAIQELSAQNTALSARLAALEGAPTP